MASLPIRWIETRAFCQATEDEDRVLKALETLCSSGSSSRDALEGQFGNPLLSITCRIESSEDIRLAWARWSEAGVLRSLQADLESRVDDDGILHFRVDKQAGYAGRLVTARTADSIDIRVKLKAYPARRGEILKVARGLVSEGA